MVEYSCTGSIWGALVCRIFMHWINFGGVPDFTSALRVYEQEPG
jgi:hypothetical protein